MILLNPVDSGVRRTVFVTHGKHGHTKIALIAFRLIAVSSLSQAQNVGSSGTHDSACEVPIPKKAISEWSDSSRYQEDNVMLELPSIREKRIAFFGSSTIENWGRGFDSTFFPGTPYINRGVSGETIPQMFLRFQSDIVELRAAIVVLLDGTNDIAGTPLRMPEESIRAMASSQRLRAER